MDRSLEPSVRRRRLARRAVIVAGLAVSGWALFVALPGWLEPGLTRARVRIERVDRGRVEAAIQSSGTVVPAAEIVVSSPLETRVISILKRPGESVRRGEAILALDTSTARVDAERLDRRLEQQRNERMQLDLALDRELAELDGAIEIQRMELEILRYRAGQQQRLFTEGLIADGVRREAEVAVGKGEVTLRRLEHTRENANRTTAARREALDLDLAVTRAEAEQAWRRLERATTRSERDGVVTWIVDEEGATVRQGEPVARIADLGSFRVEATVSDVHAERLLAGGPARVVVGDVLLDGRLVEIEPAIENGIARFTVALDHPDHPSLRSNLRVDVWVITGARENVLRVRKGAFVQGGAVQQVFVVEGGRAIRRDARVGLSGREHLEIVEGLREGDEVIVSDMRDRLHLTQLVLRGG